MEAKRSVHDVCVNHPSFAVDYYVTLEMSHFVVTFIFCYRFEGVEEKELELRFSHTNYRAFKGSLMFQELFKKYRSNIFVFQALTSPIRRG